MSISMNLASDYYTGPPGAFTCKGCPRFFYCWNMLIRPNTKNLAGVIFFLGPILGVAGHALFSPNRIAYLSLGRSYRAPYVVQNDQNHHISGYGSRFQSATTFRFRDICEKPFFGSRNRQKIEIFAFDDFVILGVKIGFFDTTESIPAVGFSL